MLAVKVKKDGTHTFETCAKPHRSTAAGHHEALIKVLRAGICNTDLEIMKGYMGFAGTLGHEFVGKVIFLDDSGIPKSYFSLLAVLTM